jgi:hypothetical protein
MDWKCGSSRTVYALQEQNPEFKAKKQKEIMDRETARCYVSPDGSAQHHLQKGKEGRKEGRKEGKKSNQRAGGITQW